MLLIPAIDLLNGACVRLFQGDFGAETRYEHDPATLLERYRSLGAPWLHVVDLDGAKDGRLVNRALIGSLARFAGIHLQVGGGIRSADAVEDLLAVGVQRVVVGSAAIEKAEEVAGWIDRFGPDRICLAFDCRLDGHGAPKPRTRGWTEGAGIDLWTAVAPFTATGLKHVLCTDIARDGTMTGPNTALYHEAVSRFPHLQWQASGGVRDAHDLKALEETGAAAAVSGKALLESRITSEELRPFLPNASSPA